MQIRSPVFVLATVSAIALATSTFADNDSGQDKSKTEKKHVAVYINKEDDDAMVKIKINGEAWKFQLPTLSDGEERIIATEDGRTVKAKRSGKEVTIEAGGEIIKVPADGPGMHVRFHGIPPVPPVAPIEPASPVPGVMPMPLLPPAEIEALRNSIVISGVELSEEQQKKIREAIKKAGVDKPVKFVQGGKPMFFHAPHAKGGGPMVWHEKGDNKVIRTLIITKDGETEDVELETDIKAIRETEEATQ